MREVDAVSPTVHHSRRLGRSERAEADPGRPPRAQQQDRVGARPFGFVFLGRGGEEQQRAGVVGQRRQWGGVGVEQVLTSGRRPWQWVTPRQLAVREVCDERRDEPGVADALVP